MTYQLHHARSTMYVALLLATYPYAEPGVFAAATVIYPAGPEGNFGLEEAEVIHREPSFRIIGYTLDTPTAPGYHPLWRFGGEGEE
jgi:hypothetical protein